MHYTSYSLGRGFQWFLLDWQFRSILSLEELSCP